MPLQNTLWCPKQILCNVIVRVNLELLKCLPCSDHSIPRLHPAAACTQLTYLCLRSHHRSAAIGDVELADLARLTTLPALFLETRKAESSSLTAQGLAGLATLSHLQFLGTILGCESRCNPQILQGVSALQVGEPPTLTVN